MYAELVINIEAALSATFHYHIPADLALLLRPGHLVEVEFGRRLAQGIVISLDESAPVDETKPIIRLIDEVPVVRPWQIALAKWLSGQFLSPLNSCLRLMLPPGLTRWADITLDISPTWDGQGLQTVLQGQLIELLRQRGSLRGRQIERALPKTDWKPAANQLANRSILIKASVLDPPRARPKRVRTAELIAGRERLWRVALELGRANKPAEVLHYLATTLDPLPHETLVRQATEAEDGHITELITSGLARRFPAETIVVTASEIAQAPDRLKRVLARLPAAQSTLDEGALEELLAHDLVRLVEQPALLGLAVPAREALAQLFRLRRAEKYYRLLTLLESEARPVALSDAHATTGATLKELKKLASLGVIRLAAEEVWRDSLADRDFAPAGPPILTADQARVWGRIKMSMINLQEGEATDTRPAPFLLHGVTGSGKTEIYMRAIDFALQQGQKAIVLVPEIALTPQTVRRFAARFPGRVALLHSRLSDGERFDTWRRARQGLIDIVIGPRSALFLPLEPVGVIVVDEEHDNSYKQSPPGPRPYYHARDAAIELAGISRAVIILGSATPDLVSYHRARAGRYQLLELPQRVMGHRQRIERQVERLNLQNHYQQLVEDPDDALTIPLPPIRIVDLRQELRAGNRSIFSRALSQAVTETLARKEQAILFLNRRGTSTFVLCRDCGHVLQCPRCDLPLSYHRLRAQLVCHHCGRKESPKEQCPNCGSPRIRYFGAGTEEVEQMVKKQWPEARVVRWDSDTTAGKYSHEELLLSFINQEADILVGTQMIAKGLDLPLVTLVGVVSADVSLGLPDFRNGERTYQLLSQVAGRAGRGPLGGSVIIQTYQPEHYAVRAVAEHDYTSFYLEEIRFRTQHNLPPFRRMACLSIAEFVNEKALKQAEALAHSIRHYAHARDLVSTEILGPTPPFFNRIAGRYRWQIIVRTPDPTRLLKDFPMPERWFVDIDPVTTL